MAGQGGTQVANSDPNWGSYTQLAAGAGYTMGQVTVDSNGVRTMHLGGPMDFIDGPAPSPVNSAHDQYLANASAATDAAIASGSGVRTIVEAPVSPIQISAEDFTPFTLPPIDFQPIDIQIAAATSLPSGLSPDVADTGNVWQPIVGGSIGLGLTNSSVGTPIPAHPQLPVSNGSWTNPARPGSSGWVSTDPRINAVTGGKPIPFKNGLPDFSPWSQGRLNVPGLTGNSTTDLRLGRDMLRTQLGLSSDAAVQRLLKSQGVTLHHNENGFSLDKIPSPLHNNLPHSGGATILRNWDSSLGTPEQFFKANRIAAGGRYLGAAGMAYGAVVDGRSLITQYQISQQTGNYSNFAAEGLRVAGGWGGAWAVGTAGAEFGAGFGSVFGPVGFVVGGLVGGVVGGALGYAGGSYAVPGIASDIGLLPGQGG